MGIWGVNPWENDSAADWFADLFDNTKLHNFVEKTLHLDTEENYEEIRAAASIVIMLGDTYKWPVDLIDPHCELAENKLQEILEKKCITNEDFVAVIKAEIAELKSRYTESDNSEVVESKVSLSTKSWWKFWK